MKSISQEEVGLVVNLRVTAFLCLCFHDKSREHASQSSIPCF